jgi:DNA-binding LacI/PurR family transcriptional regulator
MLNKMAYTNFVPDSSKGPSSLERLDWILEDASSRGNELYILAISGANFRNPDDAAKKYAGLRGVHGAVCVNGTIDFIVIGNEKAAKAIARELHEKTGEKIAIIKYNPDSHTYLDIREAMDVTKKSGDPWHLYKPETESIDALIKK